jgi:hypothetical protein
MDKRMRGFLDAIQILETKAKVERLLGYEEQARVFVVAAAYLKKVTPIVSPRVAHRTPVKKTRA